MKTRKRIALTAAAVALTGGLTAAPTASATTGATAARATASAYPTATSAGTASSRGGVIASYHDKKIDLSKGWGSAQVCAELAVGDVRCYDTVNEAHRVTGSVNAAQAWPDCPQGWVCLYERKNFNGRRLMWSSPGHKKLAQWGFRDQASSAAVWRPQGGVECIDYHSGPDARMLLAAGSGYDDFTRLSYPWWLGGGNWNDKVDEISM
ncbi:peptidase inhibitor family I36 protein [Streptomyces lydicus]|uniref:peptidase inhibitor family I36 protein n=1 Tax=Streptomyces lydicus TaxID=47763 RepID=UPI00378BF6B0